MKQSKDGGRDNKKSPPPNQKPIGVYKLQYFHNTLDIFPPDEDSEFYISSRNDFELIGFYMNREKAEYLRDWLDLMLKDA